MQIDKKLFRPVPGKRGYFILILGLHEIIYGLALVITLGGEWWPASQGNVIGISTVIWGWIWIAFGLFLLTGVYLLRDRWQFSAAMLLYTLWGLLALLYSLSNDNAGLWGPSTTYLAIAAIILISSGWRAYK